MKYSIAEFRNGKLWQTYAGLGRFNKGTWDCHFRTESTAKKHLAALKKQFPKQDLRIEID